MGHEANQSTVNERLGAYIPYTLLVMGLGSAWSTHQWWKQNAALQAGFAELKQQIPRSEGSSPPTAKEEGDEVQDSAGDAQSLTTSSATDSAPDPAFDNECYLSPVGRLYMMLMML
ncbi:hypothetical protein MMC21_002503 [Puttea exsequens]|nr:hypothetical protein [Puttea exsequens]